MEQITKQKEKQLLNFRNELKTRCYSDETIKSYIYFNERLLDFANKSTKNINQDDIKRFILNLIDNYGAKPATINLAISAFKAYYCDYRGRKFLKIKRAKKEKKSPVFITKNEILEMINKTKNTKHRLLIELLYSSGLRVSEAIKLKIEDIYFNESFLIVKQGKGKKDRYAITSKRFINDLIKFLEGRTDKNPYVFVSNHNIETHISKRTAEKIVKNAAKKAGIKKRVFPHALRSSFATQLHKNGVDSFILQKLLGHERPETTKVYTKTDFNMLNSITSPLD